METAGAVIARRAQDLRVPVLAFGAGIALVFALPALPTPVLAALLAFSALPPWRGRLAWSAFVLGVLLCSWRAEARLGERWPADRHNQTHWIEGVVASLPEHQSAPGGAALRFRFDPIEDGWPSRLRVSWYRAEAGIKGGECWRLQLRLRTPRGSLNPGGFDYEGWLLRQGIGATATVRDAQRCDTDPGGYRVLRLRQRTVDRLRAVLGETTPATLIAALAVGDSAALRDADWDRFRVTGTSHLMAISGFHLAVVAGAAFFLLRWSWSLWPRLCLWLPAQRAGLYGSALVAVGYALMTGFQPPVARALIMLLTVVAAAAAHRLREPSRALVYAWGLILAFDPFAILAPGLWLSFGAVAAILYLSLGRLRTPSAWRASLQLQLFLSLALVPLTLHFFQGMTWLSPLANLVALPVFAVLTPLLLGSVLLLVIYEPLGAACLRGSAWLLDWAYRLLALGADAAPAAWIPGSAPLPALALGVVGAVLAFLPRGVPLRQLAVPCLAVLLLPRSDSVRGLELTALDVGQGLSVVVRTPNHTLLYDAGPAFDEGFDAGRSVVAPYLLHRGWRRIDRLLLSHGHNDHAGGIPAVRSLLGVREEIGTPEGSVCRDGERWEWDGVVFRILHPQTADRSDNEASCVLRIDGPFSVLLPGDIERRSERRLLRDRRELLDVDVLLSPHHGSLTSSSVDFVEAAAPRLVIHSAAWRSRFGHPRDAVVARYAAAGARQSVTGVVGAVTVRAGAHGLEVEEWRPRARRWWNAEAEP